MILITTPNILMYIFLVQKYLPVHTYIFVKLVPYSTLYETVLPGVFIVTKYSSTK